MSILNVINLLGGLAFFLYGMSLMGSGLKKTAGGRLEEILARLSSTPLRGVLLGTAVTAIIQSSSATTVMVVGFVNSGIMQLRQAIGIIMGANIGTTATGWILSLAGINGDNIWITLLKPTTFSPIIALFGTILIVFIHDNRKKSLGSILLGFAILMYGMSAMSSAASPLAESEAFVSILTMFADYPALGVLAGALITALIQSSSASVGILQALALTGAVTYSTAIPLILGMDIGACVPVLLSAIGANKNGKRTALIYLYFNLIGSILFMIVFYTSNAIYGAATSGSGFPFVSSLANASGIAVVNTVFKLFAAAVLLPFVNKLEKLAIMSVPDDKKAAVHPREDVSELLDERFLNSPGYALAQCKNVVNQMAELDVYNINAAISLLDEFDEEAGESITLNEDIVDEYEDKLGTYLIKVSSLSLTDAESRDVSKLLHSIGDFERISDHSINLYETAQEISQKEISFSSDARRELDIMSDAVSEILRVSVQSFQRDDSALASSVEPLEEVINLLCEELKTRHIERLRNGICTIETGFVFNDIISNYERVADHCSNIAVCVIRLKDEMYDTHEYLRDIKTSDTGDYKEMYEDYKAKYYDRLAEQR